MSSYYIMHVLYLSFVLSQSHALLPLNYLGLSATEKQDILWTQISANPYPPDKLPNKFPQHDWVNASHIFDASYNRLAFELLTDELPDKRVKLTAYFGTTAKFRYVPFGNTTGSGGYTGIFNSTTLGIVRLSHAHPKNFSPSQAFKFLIDGQPAKSLLTYNGLGDRPRNYFGDAYLSDIFGTTAQLRGAANAVGFTNTIKILNGGPNDRPEGFNEIPPYELAEMKSNGELVGERVVAPLHVQLRAPDELRNAIDPQSTVDWRTSVQKAAPAGTLLFTLWGQAGPAAAFEPIGQIYTTSDFVVSQYQDEVLFFRHPAKRWVPPYHRSANHGYNFEVNMAINI